MSGFTECPNCVQDRIIVPLRPYGNSMVCPLCEFVDENINFTISNFVKRKHYWKESDVTKLPT